uniref:Calmodulin-lysine N-methyltransferase n=1 Tax=Alexandrium monilatum TaxID=311494 RepID=A0A7S4QJJ8_9DINO|mmetsp:Transcript_16155/g.48715  ORF Transcript_16155/g.48715 Transcript_16155/m.48715 type:complete len:292 (+) Transcript_16155:26-901(+)
MVLCPCLAGCFLGAVGRSSSAAAHAAPDDAAPQPSGGSAELLLEAAEEAAEDATRWLHPGSPCLPPLVEVPGAPLVLRRVVKPPDVDALWEWYLEQGMEEADASWASVWPSAAALAAHIAAQPELVRGLSVMELGAGLGAAGLTAARTGASRVTLVDREPLALHCAMATASLCGLTTAAVDEPCAPPHSIQAVVSDWGALAGQAPVSVVLGAEVLYDVSEVKSLAQCAARLLRNGGTALVADPVPERCPGCRTAFLAAAEALGGRGSESTLAVPFGELSVALLCVEFGLPN